MEDRSALQEARVMAIHDVQIVMHADGTASVKGLDGVCSSPFVRLKRVLEATMAARENWRATCALADDFEGRECRQRMRALLFRAVGALADHLDETRLELIRRMDASVESKVPVPAHYADETRLNAVAKVLFAEQILGFRLAQRTASRSRHPYRDVMDEIRAQMPKVQHVEA